MFNLFDILQAQGGPGVQGLGQQFGLTPEQTRRAMEALLPAFSLGLQRNALTDPAGFGQMFGLVGMNAAGRPQPPSQADLVIKQLFGSPHLSQAVIQQAATASGIATPIMRQMLPILAGMVVAGIVHLLVNQTQAAPAPASPQKPTPGFSPAAYWTEMMNAWMAGAAPPSPAQAPRPSSLPARSPKPQGAASKTPADETAYDVFQHMFQVGIDVQQENVKAMQGLFDAFWARPAQETSPGRQDRPKPEDGKPAFSGR